ncbi:hypothetical protein CIPAW_07G072800 [Carya illinoinensis]|uniref:Uncharacterized protein n=1 Tax=Carya illinoinensis TaxID=32201 RepID=A0A8T1Q2P4_CARIL|nr:hypothetical protein CIPAW_07G072800 [Carya illinoinensis]
MTTFSCGIFHSSLSHSSLSHVQSTHYSPTFSPFRPAVAHRMMNVCHACVSAAAAECMCVVECCIVSCCPAWCELSVCLGPMCAVRVNGLHVCTFSESHCCCPSELAARSGCMVRMISLHV